MPEGPSLIIAKEEMQSFIGKKILFVSGNTKIEKERLVNKKLLDIKTWGKHLLLCFDKFTLKVHFLMFGKYMVNQNKDAPPRLQLQFKNGEINLYTCSVKFIDEPLDSIYDWSGDVLSDTWDPKKAKKKLLQIPDMLVTDALLDQNIFAGVGNIIKNEVLYRIKVHPASTIGSLPPRKLSELIKEARNYSFDFLKWKKEYTLRKHWLAHTKKTCIRDGHKIIKEYLGVTKRRTFFCPECQVLYKVEKARVKKLLAKEKTTRKAS
jgi:Formamidopyrimidine-DNA glycosylase